MGITGRTQNSAESWASKIAPAIASRNPRIIEAADPRVSDLINYLAEEVHPNYSLIRTLRLGVAFHHGGLPDIARQEVEELYADSVIRNIVCTSTLLQGVNLPADRLIMISPNVNTTEMSDFDFMNLLGRAGRANTKLYGEIYCIDVVDEEWASNKLEKKVDKKVDTSTNLFLKKYEGSLPSLAGLSQDKVIEETGDKNIYGNLSYLRATFRTDRKHFDRILANSGVESSVCDEFSNALSSVYENISIPTEIISKNPFIDPILQNDFFERVKDDGVENWLINSMPFTKSGEDDSTINFQRQSFYYQLLSIFKRIDDIFGIERELNSGHYTDDNYINIGRLVRDAHRWMSGKKHKFFIDDLLDDAEESEASVDKAARRVTTHIIKNITFIAVKYLMLWSDMVSYFLSEEEIEANAYILNLPSMLEMGSYDPVALEMMGCGINRSVALSIVKDVKKTGMSAEKTLSFINKDKLSNIYRRHLVKAGF